MMHISPSRRRDPAMPQEIAPITVRPSTLNGISEHMVVSHYENNYGNAVRALNAVRRELAALDAGTPPYRLRGLKREELSLMGSVALHELYFGNLGGFRRAGHNSGLGRPDWHEVPDALDRGHHGGLWQRQCVASRVRRNGAVAGGRLRMGAPHLLAPAEAVLEPDRGGFTRRRPSTPRPCSVWTWPGTPTRGTSGWTRPHESPRY